MKIGVNGSTACVLIEYETTKGDVFTILDYIQMNEDGISYIQPFFDARPLIEEKSPIKRPSVKGKAPPRQGEK